MRLLGLRYISVINSHIRNPEQCITVLNWGFPSASAPPGTIAEKNDVCYGRPESGGGRYLKLIPLLFISRLNLTRLMPRY